MSQIISVNFLFLSLVEFWKKHKKWIIPLLALFGLIFVVLVFYHEMKYDKKEKQKKEEREKNEKEYLERMRREISQY